MKEIIPDERKYIVENIEDKKALLGFLRERGYKVRNDSPEGITAIHWREILRIGKYSDGKESYGRYVPCKPYSSETEGSFYSQELGCAKGFFHVKIGSPLETTIVEWLDKTAS